MSCPILRAPVMGALLSLCAACGGAMKESSVARLAPSPVVSLRLAEMAVNDTTAIGYTLVCKGWADFGGETYTALIAVRAEGTVTLTLPDSSGGDEVVVLRGSPRGIYAFVASSWPDEVRLQAGERVPRRAAEAPAAPRPMLVQQRVQLHGCGTGGAIALSAGAQSGPFEFIIQVDEGGPRPWSFSSTGVLSAERAFRSWVVAVPKPEIASANR